MSDSPPTRPPDSVEALPDLADATSLERIGRYRIERVLGQGGFGLVYLAHDDQLSRPVAIKVPHTRLVASSAGADAYLTEARTVATLDHPNIVPVHDVGSTEQFPCFVVSKYIDGIDLATRLHRSRLPLQEAVELTATVAEALHHAHKKGLVHRDIKPGNILLDNSSKPFVADFGLALREQDVGKGPRFAGTPAYMSPEQARGEGHRVDGRSDIFSLGAVLYELLTGRRPFQGTTQADLLEQIKGVEARPPRQLDDHIPKELERICLKALAKRASERYTTARDMADDLRHFLAGASVEEKGAVLEQARAEPGGSTPPLSLVPTPSNQQAVKIVPKGLRSFDATDADFFLELLPGPRDREGLPDSLRFWKSRIEEKEADNTFTVGLIYGPSGCGKSSLVKAGLLPRLAKSVTTVYVEATGEETEARLLKGLRRQVEGLSGNLGLIESLAALRQGRFLASGRKVLLVLDQFEQWLHAKRSEENTELVQALRQCDGGQVQCIVMVRDDFWLAVSRFMQAMEIRILEGENSRLVDLFDLLHARKVLTAFGRAYSRLPDNLGQCSREQDTFLDQAVSGLAQDGKVISVRLALFAEMVKGKPWTPATLREVGGTEGVGVTFLEETFAASTAPPQHRLHQKAAQAVLKALLPESGTDIKGHMRSQDELLTASGSASRPRDFDDLLRILDAELRLITPTDPDGKESAGPEGVSPRSSERRYYQLTHDYLVPSLRDWLTRKQKETRRGRAELLLADRAAVWNARPENRQLPSLPEWMLIRWWTAKKHWTPPQRQMMRKATRFHALRGLLVVVLLSLLGWVGYEVHGRVQAHSLRDRLLAAKTNEVKAIGEAMTPYRRWVDPLLHKAYAQAEQENNRSRQLHASLALLPSDAGQVEYLYERLLAAEPQEILVIRDVLAPHRQALVERLWAVAQQPEPGQESQRLRAATALAKYDPNSDRWDKVSGKVVADVVSVNSVYLNTWSEGLRPVKARLLGPLAEVYRDRRAERAAERTLATSLLADYAADDPKLLAHLLIDADEKQFGVLFPPFRDPGEAGLSVLTQEVEREWPAAAAEWEKLAKRKANAAVALVRLNQKALVWPLLKRGDKPDDQRVRSYLIHGFGPLGADAGTIVQRLGEEPDLTIQRALLLSLGPEEFGEPGDGSGRSPLKPAAKHRLVQTLKDIYRTAADPGLQAAAEWLLRQWQEQAWLAQTDEGWAKDKAWREKRQDDIRKELASRDRTAPGAPQWYVTKQGQRMVVLPGPVEFVMGSPATEAGRFEGGKQHRRRIGWTFALAAKPVTLGQFQHYYRTVFKHDFDVEERLTPTSECPVNYITWFQAVAYCNWLSREEGLPECYETDGKGQVTKLKGNYLSLMGYRLPTEAEMEYATRAGAVTRRYYGETEELLEKYAWYLKNSKERTWPVGGKKPNDFGLFDLHGNVYSWCQEQHREYPKAKAAEAIEDKEDVEYVDINNNRILRGGSFDTQASDIRCAYRNWDDPSKRYHYVGFRPARTFR